ncbi:MAG: ethanolamine ammonia-lyase [Chloroflexi bacterium]|nr:MAG: ethanolamine ammonia-lyase [Chloroflexota bacterium]
MQTGDQPTRPDPTVSDGWSVLRNLTTARIALGRAGVSLPTRHHLAFQLAHAQARDAVQMPLDALQIQRDLEPLGLDVLHAASMATQRDLYLRRPDLGRRLDAASHERLTRVAGNYDVVVIVGDGLSAPAVQRHAVPLLQFVIPELQAEGWRVAPLVIATGARVALSDEVGAVLGAEHAVILIGERPGLSAPDSLGVYLTFAPRIGNTDADRNCISNIRAEGLSYAAAAATLLYLLRAARELRYSGVRLKDESGEGLPSTTSRDGGNFLAHR